MRSSVLLFATIFCLLCVSGFAQVKVTGTVYDITQRIPLETVSVLSHSGKSTFTDSLGTYSISLAADDSIYFSYNGKATKKYLVKEIAYPYAFDMSLKVTLKYALPNVIVRPKSYHMDSLENRADYAKIFNYQKPNPLGSFNVGGGTVGMDPNAIIDLFRFKHNRRIQSLQTRLIKEEQDKYIDYRFNKAVVRKLSGLTGASLDTFMVHYRPNYAFVQACNDLELYQYIWLASKQYNAAIGRKQ